MVTVRLLANICQDDLRNFFPEVKAGAQLKAHIEFTALWSKILASKPEKHEV